MNLNEGEGKAMNSSRILRLVTAMLGSAVLVGLASGCAWSIGEKKTECCPSGSAKSVGKPTQGQELLDLKKARDQGAITEDEYQAQKKKLLEK
jgi:hypothetical protein